MGGGRALTPHHTSATKVVLRGLLSQVVSGRPSRVLVIVQVVLPGQSIVTLTILAVAFSRHAVEMVKDQVLVEAGDKGGKSVSINRPEIGQFARRG